MCKFTLKLESCDDAYVPECGVSSPRIIIAHDGRSPGDQLFLAAAKIFGIKFGDTKRGTKPFKAEEGIDKRAT